MNKKTILTWGIQIIMRGFVGLVAIYFINLFLEQQGIIGQVGINIVTFLASGTLGFPGVALLYGITFFGIL